MTSTLEDLAPYIAAALAGYLVHLIGIPGLGGLIVAFVWAVIAASFVKGWIGIKIDQRRQAAKRGRKCS